MGAVLPRPPLGTEAVVARLLQVHAGPAALAGVGCAVVRILTGMREEDWEGEGERLGLCLQKGPSQPGSQWQTTPLGRASQAPCSPQTEMTVGTPSFMISVLLQRSTAAKQEPPSPGSTQLTAPYAGRSAPPSSRTRTRTMLSHC